MSFLTSAKPKLKEVISEIHQKLDAVYVFGIGSKIDMEELKLMASKVYLAFLFEHISWFLEVNCLNRNFKPEYIRTFEYLTTLKML